VAEEGESVRFQCAISGHPVPWATWDKDGVIVTPSKRLTIKERDDLRILELDEVTQEDAGLYRITLENDYGRIEATARLDIISHRGDSHSVRSTSAPLRRSLSSSRRIMGYSTKIGGRLALAGQYRASSIPSKRMYHNGQEIVDSDRIQTHIDSTNFSLVINHVTMADRGEYTCLLENEDGGVLSTTTFVEVYDTEDDIPKGCPPKIIRHLPADVDIEEGNILDLTFEIESNEPYNYIWTKDDELLKNSDEFM
jgi:myosin-light-chain kinase